MRKTKKKVEKYRGMAGVHTKAHKQAVDGPITELHKLVDAVDITVYGVVGTFVSCNKPVTMFSVFEVSFCYGAGNSSFQRSIPESLGFLAACEGVLNAWHIKPVRPKGWETDLDERADAIFCLQTIWKGNK